MTKGAVTAIIIYIRQVSGTGKWWYRTVVFIIAVAGHGIRWGTGAARHVVDTRTTLEAVKALSTVRV